MKAHYKQKLRKERGIDSDKENCSYIDELSERVKELENEEYRFQSNHMCVLAPYFPKSLLPCN